MRVFELLQALLGPHVGDDLRTRILEGFAAGDVIEVMMAVDQILDRFIGYLLDLLDIALPAGRFAVGDRIGGDHPGLGDNEHRLMIDIAENVDVVRAWHLGGLDGGTVGLRLELACERQQAANGHGRQQQRSVQHGWFPQDSKEAADYRQSAAISLPIIRSRKCDAAMPNRVRAPAAPPGRPCRLEHAKPQLTAAAASPMRMRRCRSIKDRPRSARKQPAESNRCGPRATRVRPRRWQTKLHASEAVPPRWRPRQTESW